MQDHILSTFDQDLNRLREQVLTMASMARKNLASSMRGLLERDTDLCNAAIAADQDVNDLEKNIDKIMNCNIVVLKYTIKRSCEIKAFVVSFSCKRSSCGRIKYK